MRYVQGSGNIADILSRISAIEISLPIDYINLTNAQANDPHLQDLLNEITSLRLHEVTILKRKTLLRHF